MQFPPFKMWSKQAYGNSTVPSILTQS